MKKPPFNGFCGVYGGHIADFPKPLVRAFPYPRRKRRVTVGIMIYSGIGVHYYVDVVEEDNPAWNGETWAKAWDDKEGAGHSEHERFSNIIDAQKWARDIVAKHFPKKTHKVLDRNDFSASNKPPSWFYREGD